MNKQVLRVARYRLRATFGHRWGSYLTIVLLVGLLGGLAIGAVAAARRTQSSFPAFLASTNPSDLVVGTGIFNPAIGSNAGYDPTIVATVARLPHVKRVESVVGVDVLPLGPNGVPLTGGAAVAGFGGGSVDGLAFDQDRVTVIHGRLADPRRADEFVVTTATAQRAGWRVGDVVRFGVYTNAQTLMPGFGTASVPPGRQVDVKLVGIGEVLNSQVVQDDVDAGTSSVDVLFTPAFTRPLLTCCANYTVSGLRLEGGSRHEAAVEAEVARVLPSGFPFIFSPTSIVKAKAERAIKPEAIALAVFGGIAALAGLLIASQAIGRQLRLSADEVGVLRALGADSAMTSSDGLLGIVGAVVVGSLLAVAVAVGLSPLAPIGPVRPVDPSPGIDFDWTVLGLGLVVLIVGLCALTVGLAYRQAPHRVSRRRQGAGERGSSLARAAGAAGLPAPAVAGIRFALEPGGGRNAVPARSAIVGTVLAVIVMIATVTFGASLHTLVSHPALYGWNWDYELNAGTGTGDLDEQRAATLLAGDPYVAAWAGVYFGTMQLDGQVVPVLGASPKAAVGPPILSGHGFDAADQVVLGPTTLAQLHKHVGDTVDLGVGATAPTRLRIVGTATLPAIGSANSLHLEMGSGALLSYQLIPAATRNTFNNPVAGPNILLVRFKPGANRTRAVQTLRPISDALSTTANFGVAVVPVQRPAEIVNYRSLGSTPVLLGSGLAVGAVAALGLTLMASVRRRRRDLALLKTLGLTRPQLLAVVAWQASVVALLGGLVGVPLGAAIGRWLWILFAEQIHAVPSPSVPALSIALIAAGALVLANVVAALPGRVAARTPTALLLRAE